MQTKIEELGLSGKSQHIHPNSWMCACLVLCTLMFSGVFSAYFHSFIGFRDYDDEGLFLYAIHNFFAGHALYDEMATQAGPAYFLFHSLIWSDRESFVTHDNVRLLSAAMWVLGSGQMALAAYKVSRSTATACLGFLASFSVASVLTHEPSHPQALLFVVTATCYLAALCYPRRTAIVVLGALVGIAAATKINIGAFMFVAVAWGLLSGAGSATLTRSLQWILAIISVLLPTLLMKEWLNNFNVFSYATVTTLAIVGLLLASASRSASGNLVGLVIFVVSFATAFSICAGFALARGTTFPGLYDGLIGQHMGFAREFFVPPPVGVFSIAAGVLSAVYCAFCVFILPRSGEPEHYKEAFVVVPKILLGFAMILAMLFPQWTANTQACLLPWVWIAIIPPTRESGESTLRVPRILVAGLAVVLFLQAYPVCGSQWSFAGLGLVPVSVILLTDVQKVWRRRGVYETLSRATTFARMACAVIGFFCFTVMLWNVKKEYDALASPTYLRGVSRLRLPESEIAILECVAANVKQSNSCVLTIPGMYSFCLWSGVDSPTLMNQTNWPIRFTAGQRFEIWHRTRLGDDALIVRHEALLHNFWNRPHRDIDNDVVLQSVDREFQLIAAVGPYELFARIQDAESIKPFGASWVHQQTTENGSLARTPRTLCQVLIHMPALAEKIHLVDVLAVEANQAFSIAQEEKSPIIIRPDHGRQREVTHQQLRNEGIFLSQPTDLQFTCSATIKEIENRECIVRLYGLGNRVLLRVPFINTSSAVGL